MSKYVETNGKEGHIWRGVPTLLLTTTGRRSDRPQMRPLIYGKDGDRHMLVASKGGDPKHPVCCRNLVAQPSVAVQVAADKFIAKARPAVAKERTELWERMNKIRPVYADYQKRTNREIPVVVLERA